MAVISVRFSVVNFWSLRNEMYKNYGLSFRFAEDIYVLLVIIMSSMGNFVKKKSESVAINQSLGRSSTDCAIDRIGKTLMHKLLLHCSDRNSLWEERFISEGFKGFTIPWQAREQGSSS